MVGVISPCNRSLSGHRIGSSGKQTQLFLAEVICVYLKTYVDFPNKLHLLTVPETTLWPKCSIRAHQRGCLLGNPGYVSRMGASSLALVGTSQWGPALWLPTVIPASQSEPPPEAAGIYLETNCAAVWDTKWKKISSHCNPSWNEMAVEAPEENCSIKSKANLNSKDGQTRALRWESLCFRTIAAC